MVVCIDRQIDLLGGGRGEHPVNTGGEQVCTYAATARRGVGTDKVDIAGLRGGLDPAEVISN